MGKKHAIQTPATSLLADSGTPYALHQFEFDDDEPKTDVTDTYARQAAELMSVEPNRYFSTIITKVDSHSVAAVIPASSLLDEPALAASVGGTSTRIVSAAKAEKRSGYEVGGISPLGMKDDMPTVVDVSALNFQTIFISAGKRGFAIEMSPRDLTSVAEARFAPIARFVGF